MVQPCSTWFGHGLLMCLSPFVHLFCQTTNHVVRLSLPSLGILHWLLSCPWPLRPLGFSVARGSIGETCHPNTCHGAALPASPGHPGGTCHQRTNAHQRSALRELDLHQFLRALCLLERCQSMGKSPRCQFVAVEPYTPTRCKLKSHLVYLASDFLIFVGSIFKLCILGKSVVLIYTSPFSS